MAVFVPNFKQDIFISYAEVDNEKIIGTDVEGWVRTLVNTLEKNLARKLGNSDIFSLWIDYRNLPGNISITTEIKEKLSNCAVFIPIISPGYIASERCKLELEIFLNYVKYDSGRLFVVEHEFVEQQENKLTPLLSELRGYPFWFREQDTGKIRILGYPKPNPTQNEYYEQIADLADAIADKLKQMRNENITPIEETTTINTKQSKPDELVDIIINPENTEQLQITSKPDTAESKKIIRLHKRVRILDQKLDATYNQLDMTLNAEEKVILKNKIAELEAEMQTIAAELTALE